MPEADELDWKVKPYDYRGELADEEARKCAEDIAAFANRRGGVLIFGVAEEAGRASAALGVEFDSGFHKWVRQTVANRVFPHVPVHMWDIPDPELGTGAGYVALAVLRSPVAPHAIAGSTRDDLRYRVRTGAESRYLTEYEVAQEYANRIERRQTRDQRHKEMRSVAREIGLLHSPDMATGTRMWLTHTIVPEVIGSRPVTRESFDEARSEWPNTLQSGSNLSPGFRHRIMSVDTTTITGAVRIAVADKMVVDRHEDGSTLFASAVPVPVHANQPQAFTSSGAVVVPDTMFIGEVLRALRTGVEHARRAGCHGMLNVAVGVGGHVRQGSSSDTRRVALSLSTLYSMAGEATVPGDPTTALFARSVAMPPHRNRQAFARAVRTVATPLLQTFGQPEVRHIDGDGNLTDALSDPSTRDRWTTILGQI